MKGIMVTLLIFMMTGIVVGQQSDSNQFQSVYKPAEPNQENAGSNNFSPAFTADQIKPFDLAVSDADIRGIRKSRSKLISEIKPTDPTTGRELPPSVVSGITLVHQRNLDNDSLPIRRMYGENGGNGVLRFGLDDFSLTSLETKKLSFEFNEADRGKFNVVEFYYKPPVASNGQGGDTPTPDNGFGSPTAANSNQNSIGFIPPPGPESVPGDVDFEGPVMAPQYGSRGSQFTTTPPNRWSPEPNSQSNPAIDSQSTSNAQAFAAYQRQQQERQEQERLARIARQNETQFSDQFGTSPWRNPGQSATPTPTSRMTEQEVAAKIAEIEQRKQLEAYQQNLANRDQQLAAREAELKRKEDELNYQRYIDSLKTQQADDIAPRDLRASGPIAGTTYPPFSPVIEAPNRMASRNNGELFNGLRNQVPPERFASNDVTPRPQGIKGMAASIPGTTSDAKLNQPGQNLNADLTEEKKQRRAEGFIYFLLLCSLGLNVYLGLISRGFYVRYNELADELRETFTATM